MAALAPSPSLSSVEIGAPIRRRPSGTVSCGRDRGPFDRTGRAANGGEPGFGPLSRIDFPFPAVDAPSSTTPIVARPLPRRATVAGGRGQAPEVGALEASIRPPPRQRLRMTSLALISTLLLHGAVATSLLFATSEIRDGGGATEVTMVDLVEVAATEAVDAVAGSPTTAVPIETPPILDAKSAEEASPLTPPAAPREIAKPEPIRPPRFEMPRSKQERRAETHRAKPQRRREVAGAGSEQPRERRNEATTSSGTAAADRRSGGAATRADVATSGAGEVSSWRASVMAALARAKRYPEEARALGRTGRASVTFTIRRDGSVVGIALASSSGVGSIDGATLEMPRRAAFPPMPAGAGGTQTFTAGVRYDLH